MKRRKWLKSCFSLLCSLLIMACSFNYDTVTQNNDEPNIIMENTEYIRIQDGSPEIRVYAEEIRRYEAKHIMELDSFSFEQYNAAAQGQREIPGINATGKAAYARMETDTGNVFMSGDVFIEVKSEDFSMETAEISWQDDERTLTAAGLMNIKKSDGTTMQGTGFSADSRSRSWEFESGVTGSIIERENND